MTKILKAIGIGVSIIALLVLLVFILLVTFVSPNRFKPLIIDEVKKNTGRELVIDGDLSWTFFPTLGVKLGHMALGNPAGFKQTVFAEFSNATVSVRLLPLLHSQIKSNGILLQGMQLNLIKQADGKVNWVFPKNMSTQQNSASNSFSGKTATESLGLAISSIDVMHATITWTDEQAKKQTHISEFELHAKDIKLTKPFPISMEFDFSSKNQTTSGHVTLASDVAFNLVKQVYTLRELNLNAEIQQATKKKIDVSVTGDVMADLVQQTLEGTNLKVNLANLDVTGKIEVAHLTSTPQATGHFEILPFDLKTLLNSMGQDTSNLQVTKNVRGNIDFSASATSVTSSGKIKIDELQASKIKMTDVNIDMCYKDNVLNLDPVVANLYKGTLNAKAQVILTSSVPQISLQAKLTNVQAEPLMQDLAGSEQKLKIIGAGNVDLQITTEGLEGSEVVKNLNGAARISFTNGTLQGIDIGYLIDTAYSLISKQTATATDNNKTNFGNLTATAVIHDGVISNNDLLLDSPRFTTNGKGTIDLVNQNIDYALQTSAKEQANAAKGLSGLMIPIRVKGKLNSPTIRLDTDAVLKAGALEQLKTQKAKIMEKIKDKVPGKAGEFLQNLLGK